MFEFRSFSTQSATVEHHSAVRDCRVVPDDIHRTLPVGQRAGEAQYIKVNDYRLTPVASFRGMQFQILKYGIVSHVA